MKGKKQNVQQKVLSQHKFHPNGRSWTLKVYETCFRTSLYPNSFELNRELPTGLLLPNCSSPPEKRD